MARIRIADLDESKELDRQAMQQVRGGARQSAARRSSFSSRYLRARVLIAKRRT